MPLSLRMREVLDDLKLLRESSLGINMVESEMEFYRATYHRLKDEFIALCKEEDAVRRISHTDPRNGP